MICDEVAGARGRAPWAERKGSQQNTELSPFKWGLLDPKGGPRPSSGRGDRAALSWSGDARRPQDLSDPSESKSDSLAAGALPPKRHRLAESPFPFLKEKWRICYQCQESCGLVGQEGHEAWWGGAGWVN